MKFNHFTFPVGGPACDAACPFCVSRMTGKCVVDKDVDYEPEWSRFETACRIAKRTPELMSALLTGKGEPTLYPELITKYLDQLKEHGDFPIIELQTNGIQMAKGKLDKELVDWHIKGGLQTIAISVVHYKENLNKKIYCAGSRRKHFDLAALIKKLHDIGYSVRLCVMLLKGYVDNILEVNKMIDFAHKNEVEHLTFRSIEVPEKRTCKDKVIYDWTIDHQIENMKYIINYISKSGTKLMELSFGATVYGFPVKDGEQNVCVTNCLTETDKEDQIRQLIFFPEKRGRIGYSWQHEAATIL